MKKLLIAFLFCYLLFSSSTAVLACSEYDCDDSKQDQDEYLSCLAEKKSCLENKLGEVKEQKASLTNSINVITSSINLQLVAIESTLAEISQLEKEITLLNDRITTLDYSLDQLTSMLIERIRERYKKRAISPFVVLAQSSSFTDAAAQAEYVSQASLHTASVMQQAEVQKKLYDLQKAKKETVQEILENKKNLLESQRLELDSQKTAQQKLLQETQNSEVVYQKQLKAVISEYEAIQAIIAGGGEESKVGKVEEGDKIASVISGVSCNSSGTHLHFMVTKDSVVENPFNYLSSIDHKNCSGGTCESSSSDAFNPSGDWRWPLSGPITLSQGFGSTWAVRHTWVSRVYSFHNGIDITGSSNTVRAVSDGELYRGSFTGGGGCALRYVKLVHKDSDLTTWYLHINY